MSLQSNDVPCDTRTVGSCILFPRLDTTGTVRALILLGAFLRQMAGGLAFLLALDLSWLRAQSWPYQYECLGAVERDGFQ